MRKVILAVLLSLLVIACVTAPSPIAAQPAPPAAQVTTPQEQKPPVVQPALPVQVAADPVKMAEPKAAPDARPPGAPPVNNNYVIGAEDELSLKVWEDVRFSGNLLVLPDGRISLPFYGPIMAAGLTPPQLQDSINKALETCCLQASHATVQLVGVHSKKIYFDGDGIKTGSMDLAVPLHLLEAISAEGGFRDFADKKHITVLRDGKPLKVVNYNDLIRGKKPELNILLQPGDHIIVK